MTVDELEFIACDCCCGKPAATVSFDDGTEIGISLNDGGTTYSVDFYNAGGLVRREVLVSADRVNEILTGI